MSERKVNLKKIISKHYNLNKDEDGNSIFYEWEVIRAIKEACRQILELAAENAEVRVTENALIEEGSCYTTYDDGVISATSDKQSILDTIKQIE